MIEINLNRDYGTPKSIEMLSPTFSIITLVKDGYIKKINLYAFRWSKHDDVIWTETSGPLTIISKVAYRYNPDTKEFSQPFEIDKYYHIV